MLTVCGWGHVFKTGSWAATIDIRRVSSLMSINRHVQAEYAVQVQLLEVYNEQVRLGLSLMSLSSASSLQLFTLSCVHPGVLWCQL